MLFSLCVILSLVFYPVAFAAPEVKIRSTILVGRDVTGLKQDFFGGESFILFLMFPSVIDNLYSGIPYVEPPLGQLRFRPPVPLKILPAGSFDASNYGHICYQPVRQLVLFTSRPMEL
jgi:hypothetical protein